MHAAPAFFEHLEGVFERRCGVGMAPERVRAALGGEPGSDSVGLGNVDERLRRVFGDPYGLVVATAPGAGMKVSLRVPKWHPGVHA